MQVLTGFHAILESLRAATLPFRGRLLVSGSGPRVKEILELAARKGILAERTRPEELDRLAPGHRGIALEAPEDEGGPETDLDGFLATVPESALVLVLDHIEDPQNLGAVLRSADAFGVDLVVAPRRRAAPLSDAAARASAGAAAYVPLALVPNLAEALRKLSEAGFWSYAADMDGAPLPSADLPARCAIVLGNEGAGVSRLLREACDGILAVPMSGHVDSLNVSVTAALFMYEYRRRRPA